MGRKILGNFFRPVVLCAYCLMAVLRVSSNRTRGSSVSIVAFLTTEQWYRRSDRRVCALVCHRVYSGFMFSGETQEEMLNVRMASMNEWWTRVKMKPLRLKVLKVLSCWRRCCAPLYIDSVFCVKKKTCDILSSFPSPKWLHLLTSCRC